MILSIKKIGFFLLFFLLFSFPFFSSSLVVGSSAPDTDDSGIHLTTDCMLNGTCKFSFNKATGIKKDKNEEQANSPMHYIQDVILGGSLFIGVVVTVALVLSGFLYVASGANSSLKTKAKSGMKYALIGLVIALLPIVIVRLVQFLAKGGS